MTKIQERGAAIWTKELSVSRSPNRTDPLPYTKTLSENFPVSLEQRRISPRMGLPPSPFSKGDAPYGRGYHNAENGLLPDAEAIVEETQEVPAQAKEKQWQRWQTEGFRQSRRQRHLVRAVDRMPVEGSPSRLVRGLRERRPRAFPEVERGGHIREAQEEEDGRVLCQGARRDRLEVAGDGLQALPSSFGRRESGQESHRQGQTRGEDQPPRR